MTSILTSVGITIISPLIVLLIIYGELMIGASLAIAVTQLLIGLIAGGIGILDDDDDA